MDPFSIASLGLGIGAAGVGAYNAYNNQKNSQPKNEQIQRYTQPQQGLQSNAIGAANQALQGRDIDSILNEEYRNFNQRTQPGIANLYSKHFGEGSNRSGGYQMAQSQAQQDLTTRLAALRANYNNNSLGGLLQAGLQPSFDIGRTHPNQNTNLGSAFEGLSPYLGSLLSGLGSSYNNQQQNQGNSFNKDQLSQLLELMNQRQGNNSLGGQYGVQQPQFGQSPNVNIRPAGV